MIIYDNDDHDDFEDTSNMIITLAKRELICMIILAMVAQQPSFNFPWSKLDMILRFRADPLFKETVEMIVSCYKQHFNVSVIVMMILVMIKIKNCDSIFVTTPHVQNF